MNDVLSEVASEFKFGNETICIAQVPSQIPLLELSLSRDDLFDLLGEDLVSFFFAIEEFGSFGSVVDNFRNLVSCLSDNWFVRAARMCTFV